MNITKNPSEPSMTAFQRNQLRIVINVDASTGQWLVTKHNRRSWDVLKRCANNVEAYRWRADYIKQMISNA